MKYQVMVCLGNYDSWDEANAARVKYQKEMTDDERDKIIHSRVVDSNYKGPL